MGNKTGLRHAMVNSDPLTGEFCEILTLGDIFGDLVNCDSGPFPGAAFSANYPDSSGVMQGVTAGVGVLTDARVYQLEVPDENYIYHTFINELAYDGGRVEGPAGSRIVYDDGNGRPVRAVYAPLSTNLVTISRDLTAWSQNGGVITAYNQVGIDGIPDSASYIEDSGSGFQYVDLSLAGVTISEQCSVYFSLEKSGVGIFAIQMTSPASIVQVDVSDGSWSYEPGSQGMFTSVSVVSEGNFWKVIISFTAASTSYTIYLHPGRTSSLGGGAESGAAGSHIIDAVCAWDNTTHDQALHLPPIYTGSVIETRDRSTITIDSANQDDTQGTWLIEAEATATMSILNGFLTHIGTDVNLYDGTNSQSLSSDFTMHKIGVVYGDGAMRLNVDSVWHAEGPYDGTLLQGALDLFRNAAAVGYFGPIARYDEKDELIVDSWMAGDPIEL